MKKCDELFQRFTLTGQDSDIRELIEIVLALYSSGDEVE